MGQFSISPDARNIADRVLRERNGHYFRLLRDALQHEVVSLVCVANEKDMKAKGKTIWAQARKIGAREAFAWSYFTEADEPTDILLVEINAGVWAYLDKDQREALIAHELLHFAVAYKVGDKGREEWAFGIVGHDLEEFRAIVDWFGTDWRPDLKQFAETIDRAGQASLLELVEGGTIDTETGEITIEFDNGPKVGEVTEGDGSTIQFGDGPKLTIDEFNARVAALA